MHVLLVGPPTVHLARWRALLEELGFRVTLVSYGEPAVGAVAELPGIGGGRVRMILTLVRAAAVIRRTVRSTRPDIVHAHWLTGPAWAVALAGARPLVVSAWGSDALVWTPASRLARALARLVARRALATTYDADAVRDALIAEGFRPSRLVRVVFGADANRFRPRPRDAALLSRLGAPGGTSVVLSPRGLADVYRSETVVTATAAVAASRPVTLLARVPARDADRFARLQDLAEAAGFAGLVPYGDVIEDELPPLLASVDVVVSVPESDGTSVLLLEALLAHTPVIASDLPANREWIPPEADWLVPVGDAAALAAAIERVLADPEQARRTAAAIAVRVREAGDRSTQLAAMRLLYRDVISSRRPRHR